ncbi:MAG: zinc metallopeptidase [Planctomycetia bacterium]|nr:zinc metallopeptidase [Planctomycetia bacterium]
MDFIPVSLIYALPLLPFFVLCWAIQSRSHRTLHLLSEEETNCNAEDVAKQFLEKSKLSEVSVVKSDDFSKNEFDAESNSILLSPDTIGHKDIASIGLALRAVGHAIVHKNEPSLIKYWKNLQRMEIILFWIVFTVLAFGLMASSLPISILGYGLGLGILTLYYLNVLISFRINRIIVDFIDNQKLFREDERKKIHQILFAEAIKF